jgi:hypothetical protein
VLRYQKVYVASLEAFPISPLRPHHPHADSLVNNEEKGQVHSTLRAIEPRCPMEESLAMSIPDK